MNELNLIPVVGYRYCSHCLAQYPEQFSCCPACAELAAHVEPAVGWAAGLSNWSERWGNELEQLNTLLAKIEQHYGDDPALQARASDMAVRQMLERVKNFSSVRGRKQ